MASQTRSLIVCIMGLAFAFSGCQSDQYWSGVAVETGKVIK